jgi:hypothetical protein
MLTIATVCFWRNQRSCGPAFSPVQRTLRSDLYRRMIELLV